MTGTSQIVRKARGIDITVGEASVSPATTVRIVAKATAETKPRNASPHLDVRCHPNAPETVTLAAEVRLARSGMAVKLVQADGSAVSPTPHETLVKQLIAARRWFAELRQHGISGSQVFTWRRLMNQGALTAAAAGEEVVPASEYRALEAQVRELQRLLGKKAMENELLREAESRVAGPKTDAVLDLVAGGWSVTEAADALDITRQHRSAMRNRPPPRPQGRPPLPDAELVADIRLLVADLPTYGYRRAHALLRRQAEKTGRAAPNPKRVYRVMKVHGLLLRRDGEHCEERRHKPHRRRPAQHALVL